MTTNPYTGMPEAFNFGDFFTSFLPTIAGIAAAPATGGFSMAPILAGAGTGAALAAAKGQDPLMGGLTGGLGGYGGGQLAPTFGSMSTAGSNAITNKVATDAAYSGSLGGMQGAAGGATQAGATSFGAGLTPGASGTIANPMAVNAATPSFGSQMLSQAQTNLGNTVSAGKDFLSSPSTAYKAFTDAGGTAMDLAMPVGTAVLSGMEPQTYAGYQDPDKDKYRGPQGQLNLSDKFDTGLRLVAEGGYIDGYATGGTIQSGGIRDLYGTPDNQPTISPGLSGFGLGRLNNLAGEQAMTQAQTLGYADGGDVVAGERGMNLDKQRALNLDLIPSLNVETGKQNYTTPESAIYNFFTGNMPQFDLAGPPGQGFSYIMKAKVNDGSTIGQNLYDNMMKSRTKMAEGGDVSNYRQDQAALNVDAQPSLNLMLAGKPMDSNDTKNSSYLMSPFFGFPGGFRGTVGGIEAPTSMNRGFKDTVTVGGIRFPTGMNVDATPAVRYALNLNTGQQEPQYARGGYLDGQGDGMSDSIPATIEGKQPARLADGEFVIPADVVSHIGNGSSKAGSKRLYAMLDKVRHARTGNKKQGKQINPAKYMPA
jgi:hypothetical protein